MSPSLRNQDEVLFHQIGQTDMRMSCDMQSSPRRGYAGRLVECTLTNTMAHE
jgi:hypothetical protein